MKIPFGHPEIGNADMLAVMKVLEGPDISIGEDVVEFEKDFAKYTGTEYAVAVNSGTTALELAIRATAKKYGYTEGKIITPSFTFVATANAIVTAGFEPLFVDIDQFTYNLNVNHGLHSVKQALQDNNDVVGILPVHLYGYPAKMNNLLCKASDELMLIEDCAEACGAQIGQKKVGSWGDAGCFSFTATKNMTTGEGGMITTDDPNIAAEAMLLRSHGLLQSPLINEQTLLNPVERHSVRAGHNYRLCNILAAMGRTQLSKLDKMNRRRIAIAEIYSRILGENNNIRIPTVEDNFTHVYQMYTIFLRHPEIGRDQTIMTLQHDYDIEAKAYFTPPCHRQKHFMGEDSPFLPATDIDARRVINLPIYPSMTDEEAEYVANAVLEVVGE